MTTKCDTKWGFQKLYDFGVSVCREQNKKTEEKLNYKNKHFLYVPVFICLTHTHTHTVPPSAPHLLSPLTDSEGRWRRYSPRHAVSSSPDPPYHLRPFSRLAVTFSSVTFPTWLPGTDITTQKWATILPSLQQTRDEIRIHTACIQYSVTTLLEPHTQRRRRWWSWSNEKDSSPSLSSLSERQRNTLSPAYMWKHNWTLHLCTIWDASD